VSCSAKRVESAQRMPTTRRFCIGILLFPVATMMADWPEFRGPNGNGAVVRTDRTDPDQLPLNWSESRNIRWKTPIPYQGWSTPVVMNGQIWLTTATEDGHDFHVLCSDAASGEILFNEPVFHCDDPEPLGNDLNSYASPSPTIEPGRVCIALRTLRNESLSGHSLSERFGWELGNGLPEGALDCFLEILHPVWGAPPAGTAQKWLDTDSRIEAH